VALGLFLAVSAYPAADELETLLTTGRAALADGLVKLAQKQFEQYLAKGGDSLTPGQTREAGVLLARALHQQEKYTDMLQLLKPKQGRLGAVPNNTAFLFWRAFAHYKLGRADRALAELDTPVKDGESDKEYGARAERLRAWCYIRTGRIDGALAAFARFDTMYPQSREAPRNLLEWGRTLVDADRLDDAREVLARLAVMPMDLTAVQEGQYWFARVLMQQGRRESALEALAVLGNCTNAQDDLRAEAWLAVADLHEMQTNRVAARAAFSNGLARAVSPELRNTCGFRLGRLLLDVGSLEEGVPLLKSLISATPGHALAPAAQLTLAQSLLDRGEHAESVDEFQHYLETFTNSTGQARAHHGKGWGLLKAGRYAEAAAAFDKAYVMFPDPPSKERCLFKVGDAQFANAQFKLAAETYRRVLDEFPESALSANALFQLAESEYRGEPIELAEVKFRQVVARYPESRFAEEALLRVAEIKERQGRWLDAIDELTRLMNVYSNGTFFAEALHGRGSAFFHLFRIREALTDFKRVVAGFPRSEVAKDAYYKQGMCHYWMGHDEEAVAVCRDFMKRWPDSPLAPEVLFWLAKYQYNQGEYAGAETDLLTFVEKYPEHPLADDCLLRAGLAASKHKEYVRSNDLLTRLIKEYPKSPRTAEARFNQGDALCQLAKFSAAILIFEEIINKYPDSSLVNAAWGRKGDCQFTLGAEDPKRYEESIESYRVVANSPDARLDLVMKAECMIGRCLEKMGKTTEAFEQYYREVIIRYFEEREKGAWHNETSQFWFSKAAWSAVDIMETKKDWRKVVSILKRIVMAGVPAMDEAAERLAKLRTERWWLY